jgi:hypothetical protein
MRTIAVVLGVFLFSSVACAQTPNPPVATAANPAPMMEADSAQRKERMAQINGIAGTWTGPGWRILPTGERVEYDQTVIVTPKVGGLAFMVEGSSLRRGPNAPPRGPGSMAIITWQPRENRYAFRSFVGGAMTDSDGALIAPDTFQWVAKLPGAWLRFTVKFDATNWSEVGERSTDQGKTWTTTYGVDMTRAN